MAKPRLIILIRHAQSEGNKNREIHQSIPDHRVKLTPDGWSQAHEAGRRLRELLRPDDTLHFFTSPYRRTRETTEGILATLTSDECEPSPFRRSNIKVYEEPRLREQDFGNFQPCSAEMERMWQERADYGHFFYRIPNGESAADAYDRVSGFNESLWRQFGEDDFASVCVLVTHGLMSRVFLMKWYHFTVEYFEDLRNVDHCEFLIMRKEDNGKFTLDTKLRTWSELKRERALKNKDREPAGSGSGSGNANANGNGSLTTEDETKLPRNKTFVVTRRWGGCPNGCNHTNHYKKRQDLEALRQRETERVAESSNNSGSASPRHHGRCRRANLHFSSEDEADNDGGDAEGHEKKEREDNDQDGATKSPSSAAAQAPPVVAVIGTSKRVERILPPDLLADAASASSPAMVSPLTHSPQYMHLGRDFGGSYSGRTSVAGSDSESNLDEDEERQRRRSLLQHRAGTSISSLNDALHPESRVGRDERHHARTMSASSAGSAGGGPGPFANRLGDAPLMGMSDSEPEPARLKGDNKGVVSGKTKTEPQERKVEVEVEEEDLDAAEERDRSIRGSVY